MLEQAPARVLLALSWVGVAEVHLTGFQSGGNQVAAEVARFLQGPPNARLRLVSLRLGDNDIYDGFGELTHALRAGLAPNLAILDVAGNHGLENPSSERFLRSLLRRSHPCELDLGALRVLDVDVGDTGIVGDTHTPAARPAPALCEPPTCARQRVARLLSHSSRPAVVRGLVRGPHLALKRRKTLL